MKFKLMAFVLLAIAALSALWLMGLTPPLLAETDFFEIKSNELGQFIDLAGDANFLGISLGDSQAADIVEKRGWNTKAFYFEDAKQIKWRIYQNQIHFFDGEKYVDLNLAVCPKIEKKEFLLEKEPLVARFKIDNYLLHKGITAAINEHNEIVFTDAKKTEIQKIAPAFAVDSKQNFTICKYELLQEQQKLEIFIDINADWLQNAAYPITIDPDTNYLGSKADGYLYKGAASYASAQVTAAGVNTQGNTILITGQDYTSFGPV